MIERVTIGKPVMMTHGEGAFYTNVAFEPPFTVGEGFASAVLGHRPSGVRLTHVITTPAATVFEVRTSEQRSLNDHRVTLKHLVDRVVQVVDHPEQAVQLSFEVPFTERAQSDWSYSRRNSAEFRPYELIIDAALQDPNPETLPAAEVS